MPTMSKVTRSAELIPNAGTVEEVLTLLRAQGCRITSSRRLLLHALFDAPGDRTAEDIADEVHSRAPDINLSTIYRNLDELERLGVVVHAHLGHGPATYHLATLAHGHLVCEQCGAVLEAPEDVFQELSRTAKTRFGFDVHPYHFAVLGRCRNCS
jgi:Fur family ferric uptake transcriptional regulator